MALRRIECNSLNTNQTRATTTAIQHEMFELNAINMSQYNTRYGKGISAMITELFCKREWAGQRYEKQMPHAAQQHAARQVLYQKQQHALNQLRKYLVMIYEQFTL